MSPVLQGLLGLCGVICTIGTLMIQSGRWVGRTEGEGRRLTDQLTSLRADMADRQTETIEKLEAMQVAASSRHSEVTARIGYLELDVRELKTINAVRGLHGREAH